MTTFGAHPVSAYELGATLYMPVIHPKAPDIAAGRVPSPSSSIVLCLEDALGESDVERGVRVLTGILSSLPQSRRDRPLTFIRPRSYAMACRLHAIEGIHRVDGFVLPKARLEATPDWLSLLAGTKLKLMPTIETPEFFDPARLIMFRDLLLAAGPDRIAAVRIGGNDLLGAMGLRRVRGATAYEGPLGWFLSMAASILISAGIRVSAPVFDIIDDPETLRREVTRDVEMGFVSKTAIHPDQAALIETAFAVSTEDLCVARAILAHDARSVFQIGGVMCEPATHAAWARRTVDRAARFGCSNALSRTAVG
jgi:citrate lyase beta subunit